MNVLMPGKDKYKELFERSADAILIIRDGKFIDCNMSTVRLLGYSKKQDILDTHPSQLSPEKQPDGRLSYEKADEMIALAFKNGSNRFEWDHKKADGTVFPVEVLLTAVPDKRKQTLHVVWRDITDRKQAEKDLQKNNELLTSIITHMPACMKLIKRDGTLCEMNPAGLAMVGASLPDQVIGKCIYDLITDDDRDRFIEFNQRVCNGEKSTLTFKITSLNGTRHHMDSIAVPLHYGPENEIVQLGITRDITEEIKQLTEKEELTHRLHQAHKMEAIGTLAGGIAHDFNNILSGIFGYSQLAKDHIHDPEELDQYIDEILKGAGKAAELIHQILTFSRKAVHEKKPLRIYIAIKEALKLLRASLPATIEIREDLHSRARVLTDPGKIHQIIMNLCTNAYHAMRDTGGVLTVNLKELAPDEAHLVPATLKSSGNRFLLLEVQDTGHGMEEEIKNKIFEPYFTTKGSDKGTGLGLAVVHGIVEEHKGGIQVESSPGQGASFRIFLPITAEKEELLNPKAPPVHQGNENILLVDDEQSLLDSTTSLLTHYGYKVTSFSNGGDAFLDFKTDPAKYDLIVSDVTMPGLTGDILSKKILEIRPDIPIILCSGFSEKLSESMLLELGIRKFFQKPVRSHELVYEIQQIFSVE